AKNVQVKAKAYGALSLSGGSPQTFNLGDISAGISKTLQIAGTINSALNANSAELDLTVADYEHGDFDWLWALNPVDSTPPLDVTVTDASKYAYPGVNTVSGLASDDAGVTNVSLDVGGQTQNCPVAQPFAGSWSCQVDFGNLNGTNQLTIRARATDSNGN